MGSFQTQNPAPGEQDLLQKNRERGATRKETEQVLSTIQGMLFDLKKFLAQAITYQKTHAQGP